MPINSTGFFDVDHAIVPCMARLSSAQEKRRSSVEISIA